MTPAEILIDAFTRVRESAETVLDGLDVDQLAHRPTADANPIGWLVWHLTRVQDDHVATVASTEEVYTAAGFDRRFGLPYEDGAIGYGQSSKDVGAGTWDAALLLEYLAAVHDRTVAYLMTLSGDDLGVVVDEHWDPPVTLGARLVSVVNDDTQHVGQAAYVRGLLGL